MFAEKFRNAFDEGFKTILNENIIQGVQFLEQNHTPPSQLAVEYNFTKNTYELVFVTLNTDQNFDISNLPQSVFHEKTIVEIEVFKNRELEEIGFYLDTCILEKSYEENKNNREELKKVFDKWNPYSKDFLNYCLMCFDGRGETYFSGITYNNIQKTNSFTCHLYPSGDVQRHKQIIKNLCYLYQITSTEDDIIKLEEIINKIIPILSDGRLKISYKMIQSETSINQLELIIHPFIADVRQDILEFVSNHLVTAGFLDELTSKQLNLWQYNNDDSERRFGFIKIKFVKDASVDVEITSLYGVI